MNPLLRFVAVALTISTSLSACGGPDRAADDGSDKHDVVVVGELPRLPLNGPDRSIGTPAPQFSGSGFDGDPITVEPGRPFLVVVVSHWCGSCEKEMDDLVAHTKDLDAGRLQMLVVITDIDQSKAGYPPKEWLNERGWSGPVLVDSGSGQVATSLGADGAPLFVSIDKDGLVVDRAQGPVPMRRVDEMVAAASR